MFPFGSVLTNIPLIVLAAAYLLYMGTTVFSRNKGAEEAEVCPARPAIIIITEEKAVNTGTNYIFGSLPDVDNVSACTNEEQPQYVFRTDYRPPQAPRERIVVLFTGSSIFSRPPPLS